MEELTDILVGLEQRISAYRNRYQELEKKRRRLDDEIAMIRKYLELAETLYRVEADKAKLASLSSQIITDEKGIRPASYDGRHGSIARNSAWEKQVCWEECSRSRVCHS